MSTWITGRYHEQSWVHRHEIELATVALAIVFAGFSLAVVLFLLG